MEIVNSHVHIGPSLQLNMNIRHRDVEKEMEESGVKRSFVFPFPSKAVTTPDINQWTLNFCKKRRESFIPVFYVRDDLHPPDDGFYAVKWHWVRGISDTSSNYSVLKDPDLPEFVDRVVELGLPVIFEEEFEFTLEFTKRFPTVTLIIPHFGSLGGHPIRFLKAFKNNMNIYFDTSLGSPSTIQMFISEIGPERVIFGSDMPFGVMKSELMKILNLNLNERDVRKILEDNITSLTGI
jgi:hypothetical protein